MGKSKLKTTSSLRWSLGAAFEVHSVVVQLNRQLQLVTDREQESDLGDLDWEVHSGSKEQPTGRACEPWSGVPPNLNRQTQLTAAH